MCGRFAQISELKVIMQRFNLQESSITESAPSYNIAPGQYASVITDNKPTVLQNFIFGLNPSFSNKNLYLINARSEGDYNKENNPNYTGAKGIIKKSAFKIPIRQQRCLIPADCYIEGTTENGLDKPFLVYLKNKNRPFCFAGIWDSKKNPETGEIINSFSIITTTANKLIQKIPHNRAPVILHQEDERKWLDPKLPLKNALNLLKPYPDELMDAYPISNKIKNPENNYKNLLMPVGKKLSVQERQIIHQTKLALKGMGRGKKN